MNRLSLRGVELAVDDPVARRHRLHHVRPQHVLFAHAVAMRQAALHDIGEDLHAAMTVRSKAFARRNAVLVQNAQRSKIVVCRIGIAPEGKRLIAVEPAEIYVAPLFAFRMVIICAPSESLAAWPIRRDGPRPLLGYSEQSRSIIRIDGVFPLQKPG